MEKYHSKINVILLLLVTWNGFYKHISLLKNP